MGELHTKTGASTWSPIENVHFKLGSRLWTPVKRIYVKTGASAWTKVWNNSFTDTFSFLYGQTYYGNARDSAGYLGTEKRLDTLGNNALNLGDDSSYPNQRSFWRPDVGTATGELMADAMLGATLTGMTMTFNLAWSQVAANLGDGNPTYLYIWGVNKGYIPDTLNLSRDNISFLTKIAWYGSATDVSDGYLVAGESELGTNPSVSSDRYPVTHTFDVFNSLGSTAKTNFTTGKIKGFLIQAYNGPAADSNGPAGEDRTMWNSTKAYYLEPGKSYGGETGDATSFDVTFTYDF